MIVISDTNILSSMAAGDALSALLRLFARSGIAVPVAVEQELQIGLDKGKAHLESVLQIISAGQIEVISLSAEEELLTFNYPGRLGDGEREAIALVQTRKATLLSNDFRAAHYCRRKGIDHLELKDILRLLWTRKIVSQDEVRNITAKMKQVERLSLEEERFSQIFAPE